MDKVKILIADDHQMIVEGIKSVLVRHPQFEIIADVSNGRDAVEAVKSLQPAIVIMDIVMPQLNGLDATLQIKREAPGTAIIIYSMHSEPEYIVELFKAGVSGFVRKEDSIEELVRALKAVTKGASYYSRIVQTTVLGHMQDLERGLKGVDQSLNQLTLREREVMQLLAEGKSIKEISAILKVSTRTVEAHKYKTMEKLGAQSLADLTRIAIKKKLIVP